MNRTKSGFRVGWCPKSTPAACIPRCNAGDYSGMGGRYGLDGCDPEEHNNRQVDQNYRKYTAYHRGTHLVRSVRDATTSPCPEFIKPSQATCYRGLTVAAMTFSE
jgi:hypothetical protein